MDNPTKDGLCATEKVLPNGKAVAIRASVAGNAWEWFSGAIHRQYEHANSLTSGSQTKQFWHNIQLLRLISAYGIVYIHLEYVFHTAQANPVLLQILKFGTDLFMAVAGFLSVYVLATSGNSAWRYLRKRIIRIVPMYFIFTVLAFGVENYAMHGHKSSPQELLMSLAFVPYGPYPILYPTWTLELIMGSTIITFLMYLAYGAEVAPYFLSLSMVALAILGAFFDFTNPVLALYTNPMLIDFTFGILIFKLVSVRSQFPHQRWAALLTAASLLIVCSIVIILRPFFWPHLPRFIGLGLPVAGLLLGAVLLDCHRVSANSRMIRFLANCSFSIYLCHWFVNIVSEKIVSESGGSQALSLILLVITPIVVTVVAALIYTFLEVPLSTSLTRRFAK